VTSANVRLFIPAACAVVTCLFSGGSTRVAARQAVETLPYDHIHLNVPDPAAAFQWYMKHIGGTVQDEAPNRIMYGTTRFMFLQSKEAQQPSMGGAVDHVGFSFPDLDAKVKELEAAGVKLEGPVRDLPGIFKIAFAVDPWGTRLELVQDPDLLGLHHLHLRAPNPEDSFKWLLANFGGERTPLKGKIDGIKYAAPNFSTVWILVQKGEATPSRGRAIDHIGWRVKDLNAKVAELKGKSVTMETEPRPLPLPNKTTIYFAYVAGPSGTRIELVQR
jgi:catechol 2,3-dioxygenase-like lactoylglutathione lyase family enzyme